MPGMWQWCCCNAGNSLFVAWADTDGAWTQSAGNITTWNVNGADCIWNDGNITSLNTYSGSVDGSASPISRRLGNVLLKKSGSLNIDNGLNNIYVTGTIQDYGGTLTYATGSQIKQATTDTYAGTSDAVQGISPMAVSPATTAIKGTAILLNPYDKVEYYVSVGATDCSSVTADIYESDVIAHTTEAAIAAKQITWVGTDDNKTKRIECWGYELSSGKSSVRPSVVVTGGTTTNLACSIILKRAI